METSICASSFLLWWLLEVTMSFLHILYYPLQTHKFNFCVVVVVVVVSFTEFYFNKVSVS